MNKDGGDTREDDIVGSARYATGVQTVDITIDGIQRSNIAPINYCGELSVFEGGIIGGPVSDQFNTAMRFSGVFCE